MIHKYMVIGIKRWLHTKTIKHTHTLTHTDCLSELVQEEWNAGITISLQKEC